MKISVLKPSTKKKKSLNNSKSGQKNQNLVTKNVFITKISKTFDFFDKKINKKSCFSRCFYMESTMSEVRSEHKVYFGASWRHTKGFWAAKRSHFLPFFLTLPLVLFQVVENIVLKKTISKWTNWRMWYYKKIPSIDTKTRHL